MFKWRTKYFQLVSIYMGAMLYMLKLLLNFGNQEALFFYNLCEYIFPL